MMTGVKTATPKSVVLGLLRRVAARRGVMTFCKCRDTTDNTNPRRGFRGFVWGMNHLGGWFMTTCAHTIGGV